MATTKQELENLRDKIKWEGGLAEYVINYGPAFPTKELQKQAKIVYEQFRILQSELEELYDEHNVEIY